MEKLYVNEIGPTGEVSTVGLFYSQAEAKNVVAQLRGIPEKRDCRYEIIQALRHVLAVKNSQRAQPASEE